MHRILCGSCRRPHQSVDEVRACHFRRNAPYRLRTTQPGFANYSQALVANKTKPLVPKQFLDSVPDGYYAVRQDDSHPYVFMRISRPTGGKFRGTTKVQTQHSDDLHLAYVVYDADRVWVINRRTEFKDSLLLLVTTYKDAAIAYADEIGKCCRCNKALTDERSRWFGIGPDCEQIWPWVIDFVTEKRGEYVAS